MPAMAHCPRVSFLARHRAADDEIERRNRPAVVGPHRRRRDGVLHLIDGAVYTSGIEWTKPHPEAFIAAMEAVGAVEPEQCVFVGDRLFDDIYGAGSVGMRTVLLPHSRIPDDQLGPLNGEPDAVITRLSDLLPLVDAWQST